jgi:NADPH:quinone reductase-like Zn-dependent oxidoreductase
VTVAVEYAAMNPIDWKIVEGVDVFVKFGLPGHFPYLPGFDLAGRVVAVGSDVTRLSLGDEVYADGFTRSGAFSQFANVEESEVSVKPRNVSFREAAALPLAAETSLTSLEKAGIKRGDRVLIIGGAGGVGAYGIQIAKALGASYVAAVVSSRHAEYVRSIGADAVIDYTATRLSQSSLADFDVIYDTVGGSWEEAHALLAPTGKFLTIAFWEPAPASPQYVTHLLSSSHRHLDRITAWVEQGLIRTHIDKEFDLTEQGVRAMFEYSKAGRTRGKVVLNLTR